MNTTYLISHDILKKFFVQSEVDSVIWINDKVYAGFETDFEVRMSNIDRWTKMKITCWTDDGKQLDIIEQRINYNHYRGQVLIPNTIGFHTYIHLIVQLPEYETSCKSESVLVRRSLKL